MKWNPAIMWLWFIWFLFGIISHLPPSFSVSDCRSNEMIAAEDDHTHTDRIKSQEIFQLETTISSENLRGLSLFLSFLWISNSNIAGKAHACIKAASPEEIKEEKKQATIKARKPKPVIKSCKEPIQATHWLSYNYHYILILIFHLSFFWLKTHADWFQRV